MLPRHAMQSIDCVRRRARNRRSIRQGPSRETLGWVDPQKPSRSSNPKTATHGQTLQVQMNSEKTVSRSGDRSSVCYLPEQTGVGYENHRIPKLSSMETLMMHGSPIFTLTLADRFPQKRNLLAGCEFTTRTKLHHLRIRCFRSVLQPLGSVPPLLELAIERTTFPDVLDIPLSGDPRK